MSHAACSADAGRVGLRHVLALTVALVAVVTAELSEIPEGTLLSDSTDHRMAEMYAQYLDALLP
jgi:hypothetical protein